MAIKEIMASEMAQWVTVLPLQTWKPDVKIPRTHVKIEEPVPQSSITHTWRGREGGRNRVLAQPGLHRDFITGNVTQW